jgi:hypothetical protein
MFKIFFTLALCMASLSSTAATISTKVTVNTIQVFGNGNIVVNSNERLGANCYGGDKTVKIYYHSTQMTQNALDRVLSVLLTAKSTDAKVTLSFDDSSRNCMMSSVVLEG